MKLVIRVQGPIQQQFTKKQQWLLQLWHTTDKGLEYQFTFDDQHFRYDSKEEAIDAARRLMEENRDVELGDEVSA
jgi:hypothetical protein